MLGPPSVQSSKPLRRPLAPNRSGCGYNDRMALSCNIDARGKRLRLAYGLLMLLLGLGLLIGWAVPSGGLWAWLITSLTLAAGAVAVFEARTGWCALRAMGIRTPL